MMLLGLPPFYYRFGLLILALLFIKAKHKIISVFAMSIMHRFCFFAKPGFAQGFFFWPYVRFN
jgi:hypothetical protein